VQSTFYADADTDGYGDAAATTLACSAPGGYVSDNTDCNDGNPGVNPGAAEVCNGIDDDCDTSVDEGTKSTYFRDSDVDGYGNPSNWIEACSQPSGYVIDNLDCDDTDPNEHPDQTWYKDEDDDGYSDGTTNTTSCTRPEWYKVASELAAISDDCDDSDPLVNPGMDEVLFNEKDDDCNPATKDDDLAPVTYNVVANPVPVDSGQGTVSATIDDTDKGGSVILSAACRIEPGEWLPMDAPFNSPLENVTATFEVPVDVGVYDLCVHGSDDDENVSLDECALLAVYDPNGGFVTGGGWIDSPAGAYTADPTLTGKATFGFVSKYKKGATTPTGVTEFQFKVAGLNFHSDSYEWLVVAGAGAKYKGVGTINGEGEYNFILSAIDADINENDNFDIDRFRIRIWEEDDDGVEIVKYDNGLGDDSEDAITEIGGGSIVVHTKKTKK